MNSTPEANDSTPAWVAKQRQQNTKIVAVLVCVAVFVVTMFTLFG